MLLSTTPDFSMDLLSPDSGSQLPGLLLSCWIESKACCVWSLVTQAQFGKRNPTTKAIRGQLWASDYKPGIGGVEKGLSILLDVVLTMWVWGYTDLLRVLKPSMYTEPVH